MDFIERDIAIGAGVEAYRAYQATGDTRVAAKAGISGGATVAAGGLTGTIAFFCGLNALGAFLAGEPGIGVLSILVHGPWTPDAPLHGPSSGPCTSWVPSTPPGLGAPWPLPALGPAHNLNRCRNTALDPERKPAVHLRPAHRPVPQELVSIAGLFTQRRATLSSQPPHQHPRKASPHVHRPEVLRLDLRVA